MRSRVYMPAPLEELGALSQGRAWTHSFGAFVRMQAWLEGAQPGSEAGLRAVNAYMQHT